MDKSKLIYKCEFKGSDGKIHGINTNTFSNVVNWLEKKISAGITWDRMVWLRRNPDA